MQKVKILVTLIAVTALAGCGNGVKSGEKQPKLNGTNASCATQEARRITGTRAFSAEDTGDAPLPEDTYQRVEEQSQTQVQKVDKQTEVSKTQDIQVITQSEPVDPAKLKAAREYVEKKTEELQGLQALKWLIEEHGKFQQELVIKNQEITKTHQTVSDLEIKLKQVTEERTQAVEDASKLRTKLAAEKARYQTLRTDHEALKATVKALEETIDRAKQQVSQIDSRLAAQDKLFSEVVTEEKTEAKTEVKTAEKAEQKVEAASVPPTTKQETSSSVKSEESVALKTDEREEIQIREEKKCESTTDSSQSSSGSHCCK
jgi:hypothetical protein